MNPEEGEELTRLEEIKLEKKEAKELFDQDFIESTYLQKSDMILNYLEFNKETSLEEILDDLEISEEHKYKVLREAKNLGVVSVENRDRDFTLTLTEDIDFEESPSLSEAVERKESHHEYHCEICILKGDIGFAKRHRSETNHYYWNLETKGKNNGK